MLWYGCTGVESELLETIQCEDGKIITGVTRGTSTVRPLEELS